MRLISISYPVSGRGSQSKRGSRSETKRREAEVKEEVGVGVGVKVRNLGSVGKRRASQMRFALVLRFVSQS
jgi:hypothetical protein